MDIGSDSRTVAALPRIPRGRPGSSHCPAPCAGLGFGMEHRLEMASGHAHLLYVRSTEYVRAFFREVGPEAYGGT